MELVKKIDIHAHTKKHLGPARADGTNFATPEQLLMIFEKFGIEKAVLLPIVSPEGQYFPLACEDAEGLVAEYPQRFAWFCNIDPRAAGNSEKTDFGAMLDEYIRRGAKGLGEITANLYMDDPRVFALFAACQQRNLPVTFHIGHTDGDYGLIDELGLPRLEKALQTFPKLRFLGHSQRFWAEISGDCDEEKRHIYPTGKVQPGGRVVELMRKYPNLCGDLSAGSGSNALTRDPEFGYSFLEEFQDRLYYGNDFCKPEEIDSSELLLTDFLDKGVQTGKLSYAAYLKISRENALALLNA